MKTYPVDKKSKPTTVFPFNRRFGGKLYWQSLVNPDFVMNCSEGRARETVKRLHREGWLARVVSYRIKQTVRRGVSAYGRAYVVYERRSGRESRNPL